MKAWRGKHPCLITLCFLTFMSYFIVFISLYLQGLQESGSINGGVAGAGGPRPLSVPDVDKLPSLHEPRIDSYRFSMANLEGTEMNNISKENVNPQMSCHFVYKKWFKTV